MRKGAQPRKPAVAYQRGPCLSERWPIRGPSRVGITAGKKIRPAPVAFQPKVVFVKRGRMLSKEVTREDWIRTAQRAESRRREARSLRTGGRSEHS